MSFPGVYAFDIQDEILMTGTVIFSVLFSVGLFMVLPYLLASLLHKVGATETIVTIAEAGVRICLFLAYMLLISRMEDIQRVFMYHGAEHKCINCVEQTIVTIAEAGVRICLFLAYMLLISRMEDIQRVFMYHGAEHKCINCVEHGMPLTVENVMEHGMPLTVENVMKSSRFHKRCGTSFLFFVIIISIIFFLGFFAIVPIKTLWLRVTVRVLLVPVIAGISCGTSFLFFVIIISIIFFLGFFAIVPIKTLWLRVTVRVLLVPVIAGISYEVIRLAGNSDSCCYCRYFL